MEANHNRQNHLNKVTMGGILVALGVVYGDIGTSPLYVMKAIVKGNGGLAGVSEDFILGAVSLVFWTITILTTIKYVMITLKADNHGEGGIFSLYTLVRKQSKWLIIPAMIGGATLLADGMLTPAVTVTSAVEGLREIPVFREFFGANQHVIIIIVITIISALFLIQRFGTEAVGRIFGPVMLLWFTTLGIFGLVNIVKDVTLIRALSPHYAIAVLFSDENKMGFFILGGVFLATTGAEALYSDLGHAGRKNIYATWGFVKFSLILNYFGQAAWILEAKNDPKMVAMQDMNPFFQMMPKPFLIYGVIIATLAAIIASQSLISGSYTLVSEAIKLNLMPRLHSLYPSTSKGQVYIPAVNTILWAVCIGVVLHFRSSDRMEAAYGLAITVTMLMTTVLLFNYLIKRKTPMWLAVTMLLFFGAFEMSFFISSAVKFMHGGYITVLIAVAILFVMYICNKSHSIKMRLLEYVPLADYRDQLGQLCEDGDRQKYATNLVYLTNSREKGEVESKIMYSILDKRPKRADVYWFVNVVVTDEPYTAEYTVDNIGGTDYMIKVQLKLGFRVSQKLNVFLRQIVTELVENGEVDIQSRNYTTMPDRKVGDFRFIIIQEQLSMEMELSGYETFIMQAKLFLKRHTVSPEKWFGLNASDVEIENVPLFLGKKRARVLKRVDK
ncbi:KUP/HAK/KT family potassium transporter [Carnobacterium maltaromaticum]|uniref:KUP/HAK/KT family potassium transporter n=1 Tax=Carnobacterium maltaromaticum TaxID=2751 RepID=UPI0039B0C5AE